MSGGVEVGRLAGLGSPEGVLSRLLGLVHHPVGQGKEILGVGGMVRIEGDADGDRGLDGRGSRNVGVHPEHRDLLPDAVDNARGSGQIDLRKDKGEFVAPVAGHDVTLARPREEEGRHLLEVAVPDRVAEGVVDPLEVVEVDDADGEGGVVALGTAHLIIQKLPEDPLVEETGEGVPHGKVFDLLVVEGEGLHRAQHVEDRDEKAADHELLDGIGAGSRKPYADDAPDLGPLEEEALRLENDGFFGQGGGRVGACHDLVKEGEVFPFGEKAGDLPDPLVDGRFEVALLFGGGGSVPEDMELDHFLGGDEEGEEKSHRKGVVDLEKEVLGELLPLPDDVGGDQEFFRQVHLELEGLEEAD